MTAIYILIILATIIIISLLFMMITRFIRITPPHSQPNRKISFWDKREQKLMHKRPYSIFDIPLCSFILISSIFFFIIPIIKKLQVPNPENNLKISFLVLVILFDLILIYIIIKKLKIYLLYKIATTKGEKVDGTIINYCHIYHLKTRDDNYVVVKYNDINSVEEKILVSPQLSFDPPLSLGTNKCDVYFYKNKIIAGGFKSFLDTNTHICLSQDNSYLQRYNAFEKVLAILALIVTIVIACFLIFTELN